MSDAAAPGVLDSGPPEAHASISRDLAATLVREQHPDFAHLELGERFDGWDMAVFRLGSDLTVRLPRVAAAVGPLELEARLIATHGAGWAFPHPRIVRMGVPAHSYPWPWAIVAWVPGRTTDREPLPASAGHELGTAIAQIHRPETPDAPFNPEQSLTMAERSADVEDALATLARRNDAAGTRGLTLDLDVVEQIWGKAHSAPPPAEKVWSHADLHGSNVLERGGRLGGIIDWGKAAACDRAVDLGFLYTVLEAEGIPDAVDAYVAATRCDDPGLVDRARGVALAKCLRWATLGRELNTVMAWRGLTALGAARVS
ncbi:phosphotransferase [Demequina sediminicola]|uniref:phosphotransferase n=1 Tax=Demequina sediminicola TaxID=1095026 RepID=UPI000785D24B|nr:phosphotransferase [Demequina sediminicola]